MKPDWDQLAEKHASSKTVVIADVDCTGPGEPLCQRFGVEGFPTIKSFAPPDTEGEDYEGDRSFEALDSFASSLGPSCSAATKENCAPQELAELEKLLETPQAELAKELLALKGKLSEADTKHEKLLEELQKTYDDSNTALDALKKEIKPRIKQLRAATATTASLGSEGDKDEV